MPIINSDIKYLQSTNNLGGLITAAAVVNATLENLFNNISSAEAKAGVTKYACVYVKNTHATLTWSAVKQWILQNTPSNDTEVFIGIGVSGVDGEEPTIANELAAPAGVVFDLAADEATANNLPNLAKGEYHGFWVKLVVSPDAAAVALDNWKIRTKGDTPA